MTGKKEKEKRKTNVNGLGLTVIPSIEYTVWREPETGDLNWLYSLIWFPFPCVSSEYKHFARVRVILLFTNTYISSIQSLNTSQLLHETSTEEIMACFNAKEKNVLKPVCQSPTWHHSK